MFFSTWGLNAAYDVNGMIEFNEPVPFRLTRNMEAFFSHFGVEGLLVSAMCAAAQAVVSPKVIPSPCYYEFTPATNVSRSDLMLQSLI